MEKTEFIKKYQVKIISRFRIHYSLPKGTSIFQMLQDAQKVSVQFNKIVAIYPSRLNKWSHRKEFTTPNKLDKKLFIDTTVKGSEYKTRKEQEKLLRTRGTKQASAAYLAGAHAAYFVIKNKDFFDGNIIRCKNTKLYYGDGGLSEMDESDYINQCKYKIVKTAALINS